MYPATEESNFTPSSTAFASLVVVVVGVRLPKMVSITAAVITPVVFFTVLTV